MLRYLQVLKDKPIQILEAGEDLVRGSAVVKNYETGKVEAASDSGLFLVDNAPNYDGINAIIAPTDADFENIASGALCLLVPTVIGERYATSAISPSDFEVGDPLTVSMGEFVSGSTGYCEWVYGGVYNDPTGIPMGIVERINPVDNRE